MTTEETTEQKLSGLSYNELSQSLTGYDELAIEEKFNFAYDRLLGLSFVKAGRALLFVHFRRNGLTDDEAYKKVMRMTVRETNDAFVDADDDADDLDPDEPDTEQGKDGSTPD